MFPLTGLTVTWHCRADIVFFFPDTPTTARNTAAFLEAGAPVALAEALRVLKSPHFAEATTAALVRLAADGPPQPLWW